LVKTNASDYAIVAILSIYIGKEVHPIAFHLKILNTAELNYDMHNRELLAIYKAFKKWRHYLEDTQDPLDIIIDHRNLIYFKKSKLLF